jgi:hypothetical protein
MKKHGFLIGIAVCAAIAAAGAYAAGGKKSIAVTDIDVAALITGGRGGQTVIPDFTGTARVYLTDNLQKKASSSDSRPKWAAICQGVITDGTLAADIMKPSENTRPSKTAWTGGGQYYVYIIPFDSKNKSSMYSTNYGWIWTDGGDEPVKCDISAASTALPFSGFKKHNVWID